MMRLAMPSAIAATPPRRGATLLEAVVAIALLGTAFVLGAQALAWTSAQRRLTDDRQLAMQEAVNCLERLRRLEWNELTNERLSAIDLSPAAKQRLTAGRVKIAREADIADPPGSRFRVEVQWKSRYGVPLNVAFTTWRYRREVQP